MQWCYWCKTSRMSDVQMLKSERWQQLKLDRSDSLWLVPLSILLIATWNHWRRNTSPHFFPFLFRVPPYLSLPFSTFPFLSLPSFPFSSLSSVHVQLVGLYGHCKLPSGTGWSPADNLVHFEVVLILTVTTYSSGSVMLSVSLSWARIVYSGFHVWRARSDVSCI